MTPGTRGLGFAATAVAGVLAAGLTFAACGNGGESGAGQGADAAELVQEGLAAHSGGDTATAADLYRQALDQDGDNEYALYNLGLIAQTDGRAREAERRYRAAVQADPDFTPALYNLAILRTDDADYDEAAGLYRQVVAIDPGNASAHLNLGFLLRDDLGRAAEGQVELDRAVELDPSLQGRIAAPAGESKPAKSPKAGTTTTAANAATTTTTPAGAGA